VGDFQIQSAQTLEQVKVSVAEEALGKIVLPTDAALSRFPVIDLSAGDVRRVQNGMAVEVSEAKWIKWIDGERVRMRDERGNLVAVAEYDAASASLRPSVVIARDETQKI
jgi:tRNA U55 pseudouridine synthase TruB